MTPPLGLFHNRNYLKSIVSFKVNFSKDFRWRHEMSKHGQYYCLYFISTAIGFFLTLLVIIWIMKFRDGLGVSNANLVFNWHPLLMFIAMIILYSQAFLIYRTMRNIVSCRMKYFHAAIQGLALFLAIFGIMAAFISHSLKNVPNMYTLHSWIGMMTFVIFIIQFIVGFATYLYPKTPSELKKEISPIHVAIGSCLFIAALITAITGFAEKAIFTLPNYTENPFEGILINFIGLFLVVFGIIIIHLGKEAAYKKQKKQQIEQQQQCYYYNPQICTTHYRGDYNASRGQSLPQESQNFYYYQATLPQPNECGCV